MNVLITGAAGFIGGFLTRTCLDEGCAVLGLGIPAPDTFPRGADYETCDIRDAAKLSKVISTFHPDRVFHLAAQSYPTVSLVQPRETVDVNAVGTVNLFESLRTVGIAPKVVVACSSAEYGPVAPSDLPVKETHPLRPLHPYGVSKVAQDLLAAQYFLNYSIPSIRIRIFNTTGPSKLADVCSDLTMRAVKIERGINRTPLIVGNLTSRRAIIDVRDMVRGLWIAAERCEPGEVYNVGATKIYSVQEVIDIIRAKVVTAFSVEQDPSLIRACDEPVIAGNVSKFQQCTNWMPQIDLATTVQDMLDWWRGRLAEAEFSSDFSKRPERDIPEYDFQHSSPQS